MRIINDIKKIRPLFSFIICFPLRKKKKMYGNLFLSPLRFRFGHSKKKGGRKFMTRDLSVLRNNNNSPVCVCVERTRNHKPSAEQREKDFLVQFRSLAALFSISIETRQQFNCHFFFFYSSSLLSSSDMYINLYKNRRLLCLFQRIIR
jgi:hypothetical protein